MRKAVLFGWTGTHHYQVTTKVLKRAKSSYFTKLLNQYNSDLMAAVIKEDYNRYGKRHYLQLERIYNGKTLPEPAEHFSNKRQDAGRQFVQRFDTQILQDEFMTYYFQTLQRITDLLQAPEANRDNKEIARLTGRLLHLDQDRWQPFHTTVHPDWVRRNKGHKRSAHETFEKWAEDTVIDRVKPTPFGTIQDIQNHIIESCRDTWLQMFTIAADEDSWEKVYTRQIEKAQASSLGLLQYLGALLPQ